MKNVIYEKGEYFVVPAAKKGFEIFKQGATAATRCAVVGYEGQTGLDRCKVEIERRLNK